MNTPTKHEDKYPNREVEVDPRPELSTVRIASKDAASGFAVINERDFDAGTMTLYGGR